MLEADHRPDVYVDQNAGGVVVYRASRIGSCIRGLVAAGLDYDEQRPANVKELLRTSADEGNLHEAAVIEKLIADGYELVVAQDEVDIPVIPGVVIRGHTDGILRKPGAFNGDKGLLEVKSMSKDQFKKWQGGRFRTFTMYAWQASVYMRAYHGFDCLYVVKDRNNGTLDITLIPASSPPVPWADIKKKVVTAERWRRKGELPPCDVKNTWGCPFFYLHDEEESGEGFIEDADAEAALRELLIQYREFKPVEDAGKEAERIRKEQLSDPIYSLIPGDSVQIDVDGQWYKLTKSGQTRSWVDTEAMRRDGHETLLEQYTQTKRINYPLIREVDTPVGTPPTPKKPKGKK